MESVTARNEVAWAAIILRQYSDRLSRFCALARCYDSNLLMGLYDDAWRTLDDIQKEFGYSLWLIENRLALLQIWKGLEAQKKFAEEIRSGGAPSVVIYFSFVLSQRNEEATNPYRFAATLKDKSSTWGITEQFRLYLLYRLADQMPDSAMSLSSILSSEALSPVVDQYETFIRLATHAIIRKTEFASTFATVLTNFGNVKSDYRIKKLQFLITGAPELLDGMPVEASDATNWLLTGTYLPAARELTRNDSNISRIFDAARGHVEEGIELPRGSTIGLRIADIAERLLSKTKVEEAVLDAKRLCLNCRFTSFASELAALAFRQVSSSAQPDRANELFAFVMSPSISPRIIGSLNGLAKETLARTLSDSHHLSSTIELYKSGLIADSPSEITQEFALLAKAERAYAMGDFVSALQFSESLSQTDRPTFVRESFRLSADCLVMMGDIDAAIEAVVNCYLHDRRSVRMLPVERCVQNLDKSTLKRIAGRLSTPIILDLVTRFIRDSDVSRRRYAYDDFLTARWLTKPSELWAYISEFDLKQLVYFLRYICVPEVMEVSIAFDSSREVEDERLAVCKLLADIDRENAHEYEAEMREITKKQVIQRGLRQVEQSKISIDVEPIRRWAERELKESFTRYQALQAASPIETTAEHVTSSDPLLDSPMPKQDVPDVPKNEAADLLLGMVRQILRECYLNPFHGLDCYLSMRIRHGALSGQLRAPLEDERLITQRESGSEEYSSNTYWIDRLQFLAPSRLKELDRLLCTFSKDYDGIIDKFAKRQIQICTPDKKEGLFAPTVEPVRLLLLVHEMHSNTTFDSFLDRCFALFWESVDDSLHTLRNYVDCVLKRDVHELFVKLMTSVDSVTRPLSVPEINNAIRAAETKAQQALAGVMDWFRQARPIPPKSFTFKEMIDIGIQQVTKIYRDFDPKITTDIGELPEFAELSRFSDIFFIIFANIWRHSGIPRDPKVHISSRMRDSRLEIIVANEVAPDSVTLDARSRVERIKNTIEQGAYQRAVRSEGGTGLIKLRNIIRAEPEGRSHLDFGFETNDLFVVRIELPLSSYDQLMESHG